VDFINEHTYKEGEDIMLEQANQQQLVKTHFGRVGVYKNGKFLCELSGDNFLNL